jgi:uracil-DNA glycosylase
MQPANQRKARKAFMSDSLRRQLQQRLESLRLAGVEYLPRCEALSIDLPPQEAVAPVALPTAALPNAPPKAAPPPLPPSDLEMRRQELNLLTKEVAQCSRCASLASTRTQTVFGVGRIEPDLCFIGEAPGADEDRQGEPFVGAAGQLLDRIIAGALGMKREEIFICNILRCRPPGNRPPQADEAENCREWLDKTLQLVRPKHICCLGASAAKYLLRIDLSIGRMRKRFYEYAGVPVLCTYHPSYLLRSEEPKKTQAKREVWDDMKMLLEKMGRPDPTKQTS